MEEFSRANPNVLVCRETWKLHILIPLSCDIYDDLEKADSNIQYLTDLTETTLSRAGTKKRVYKHSLYSIRDEDKVLGAGGMQQPKGLPGLSSWPRSVPKGRKVSPLPQTLPAFSRTPRGAEVLLTLAACTPPSWLPPRAH